MQRGQGGAAMSSLAAFFEPWRSPVCRMPAQREHRVTSEVGLAGGGSIDRGCGLPPVEYKADKAVVLGTNLFLEISRPGAEAHARRPWHGERPRIVQRELHFEGSVIRCDA